MNGLKSCKTLWQAHGILLPENATKSELIRIYLISLIIFLVNLLFLESSIAFLVLKINTNPLYQLLFALIQIIATISNMGMYLTCVVNRKKIAEVVEIIEKTIAKRSMTCTENVYKSADCASHIFAVKYMSIFQIFIQISYILILTFNVLNDLRNGELKPTEWLDWVLIR